MALWCSGQFCLTRRWEGGEARREGRERGRKRKGEKGGRGRDRENRQTQNNRAESIEAESIEAERVGRELTQRIDDVDNSGELTDYPSSHC